MNNYQLIKEHTLVLALIGYYDMSNKLPLEHMAFGNHHLWSYYLELHQELYNRLIESKDESISNAISGITWDGDERLLVQYVCEIDMEMLHEINSISFLQRIES